MDKQKLRRIMAESVLLRETALSSFRNKLSKKTYAEAKKVFREMGVEDEAELEQKVMDGDISAEELDIPADEEEIKEAAEDDSTQEDGDLSTEACDEEEPKTNLEKLVAVVERLHKRIENIEQQEHDPSDDGNKNTSEIDDAGLDSGSNVDGDVKDSSVDKDLDSGALPESVEDSDETSTEGAEEDEMSEEADVDEDDMSEGTEDEEEMPQPPIVKESLGKSYSVDAKKSSGLTGKTLDNLFT